MLLKCVDRRLIPDNVLLELDKQTCAYPQECLYIRVLNRGFVAIRLHSNNTWEIAGVVGRRLYDTEVFNEFYRFFESVKYSGVWARITSPRLIRKAKMLGWKQLAVKQEDIYGRFI